MRTHASTLPAAAASFFLAASLTGCVKPDVVPLDTGHAVTVIVTYDEVTKKAVMLDLGPEKKITLRKNKDWALWVSPSGLVYVTFTADTPFDSPPKHENKVLKSGQAKRKGKFEYTAELWLDPAGTNKVPIDPIIEVMD